MIETIYETEFNDVVPGTEPLRERTTHVLQLLQAKDYGRYRRTVTIRTPATQECPESITTGPWEPYFQHNL